MKRLLLSLALVAGVNNAAHAGQITTSANLLSRLLIIVESVKILDGSCAMDITASTSAEEFAAITISDSHSRSAVTLKLKASEGQISFSKSGSSGAQKETFTTSTAELSITSFEDLADLGVDLRVGDKAVSCKFSE